MSNERIEGDRLQYRRTVEAVREDLEKLLPEHEELRQTFDYVSVERPIALDVTLAKIRQALSERAKQKDAECSEPDYGSGNGYSTPYHVALSRLADLWRLLDLV